MLKIAGAVNAIKYAPASGTISRSRKIKRRKIKL